MNFWALVPVGILGAGLLGLGTLAFVAGSDPSFALESDYYQKAVRWDEQQAQLAENARLGWQLELRVAPGGAKLVAEIARRDGAPVSEAKVVAEAFANARAADVRTLRFSESAPGTYEAELGRARPGLWELRFTVERGAERFTHVARPMLPGPEGAP